MAFPIELPPPPEHNIDPISILQQYRSKYPVGETPEESRTVLYEDTSVSSPSGRGPNRWSSRVRLHEPIEGPKTPDVIIMIPEESDGLTFATKKEARQHAAGQAILYLRSYGWMPLNSFKWGPGEKSRHNQPPPIPTPVPIPTGPQGNGSPSTSTTAPVSPTPGNLSFPTPTEGSPSPGGPSSRLLDSSTDRAKIWKGYVSFGDEQALMREELAHRVLEIKCDEMSSERLAKEDLACQLLEALNKEKNKRDEEKAAYLAPLIANGTNHERR
ncbi:hypothetical protein NPX13_g8722 [Xylaria arbuscula]|uniref:DRBM domain-containing protein n=1 Tax=Xylaria arbuscula TaxID=114810 RepID=A0A9W8N857_9PEZI|nr:hypothetical protein NPX13_g8722 [Xylaria arbuscula]